MSADADFSIVDWFHASAERVPLRPALRIGEREDSYRTLAATVRELAGALVHFDPDPAFRLGGLFALRSRSAYAGLLALLTAGKGYVPLHPQFPTARSAAMLSRSGVRLLIVAAEAADAARAALTAIDDGLVVLLPDHEHAPDWAHDLGKHRFLCASEIAAAPALALRPPVREQDVAYLLFTSGTTGTPKGVGVTHANVRSYVEPSLALYAPNEGDRFSQHPDLTFDVSVHDLWLCWASGAALHPVPASALMAPARFIREHELTFWGSVPSVIALLNGLGLLRPNGLPSLRCSTFCGEPLPADAAAAWQRAAPGSSVHNLYGPTEATVAVTHYHWQGDRSRPECRNGLVPIGAPLPHARVAVVDGADAVVPEGEAGELLLAGAQVAPGYWRDPAQTAQRFVQLPGSDARWYRTGDLVRFERGPGLVYLGRLDEQLKVRGFRVETAEVERVIREGSGRDLVAVIGWPVTLSGADGLVAFVCGDALDEAALRRHCRLSLPEYMVPREIHALAQFPLNANGKIDRGALRARLAREEG